jgi:hypothetical protein
MIALFLAHSFVVDEDGLILPKEVRSSRRRPPLPCPYGCFRR